MTQRDLLTYEPVELSFGTSGLRGLVRDMTDIECYINTKGFLEFCKSKYPKLKKVYVAGDLRDSTPRIMSAIFSAVESAGLTPQNLGNIPTPVLALQAFTDGAASVMVTGSHIPADRNGIKFYKPDKELMKYDEAELLSFVQYVRAEVYAQEEHLFDSDGMLATTLTIELSTIDAVGLFCKRLLPLTKNNPLKGMKVTVYEHSAVGRDLMVRLLADAGAVVVGFGRSKDFIPVDTENVTSELRQMFKEYLDLHPDVTAIVSTDGDSDRPLFVDNTGTVRSGDVLGLLTSELLGIRSCAFPVSSSDAVSQNLAEKAIEYTLTKIGSPYVIDAVDKFADDASAAGWEVNGGYMVGNNVAFDGRQITSLMTRDAYLPILAVLNLAAKNKRMPHELFESIRPQRYTGAGLVDMPSFEDCSAVTTMLASTDCDYAKFFTQELGYGTVSDINMIDGVRITFANGDIAHVRGSGNAPQLRIYSVANTPERAQAIVYQCTMDGGIFSQIAEHRK